MNISVKSFLRGCALMPLLAIAASAAPPLDAVRIGGEIIDAETGALLPARLYIQGPDGAWHFPTSSSPGQNVAARACD